MPRGAPTYQVNALMKILLVEDDQINAEILKAWLKRADVLDLELTHVSRLAESIALLTEEQFDVVLLDLHLPDASGSDICVLAPTPGSLSLEVLQFRRSKREAGPRFSCALAAARRAARTPS